MPGVIPEPPVWRPLAGQFSLIQPFALGPPHRQHQAAGGFQFVEQLLLQRGDLILVAWHVDQVVAFPRVGLQVIESVPVPHAVVEDDL